PGLAPADADHAVVAGSADDEAGEQEAADHARRVVGAPVFEPFLHPPEVVRRDQRWVCAGHNHAESLVGAEVSAVPQNVADADHAPGAVATRPQALFVESPRNQADTQALVQIEAVDVAHDQRFVFDRIEAVTRTYVVAVRRAAQNFATHGLRAQCGAHLVSGGVVAPGGPVLHHGAEGIAVARPMAVHEVDAGAEALDFFF